MFNLIFRVEKWKFNKDYGVWVSSEGKFKDRYKRILPVKINQKGYCYIKTEQGYRAVHRLVLMTYIPTQDAENLTVDHLNHNKRDNSLKNLEWVDKEENLRRARNDFISLSNKVENSNDEGIETSVLYINNKIFLYEEAVDFISQLPQSGDKQKIKKIINNVIKNKQMKKYCSLTLQSVN